MSFDCCVESVSMQASVLFDIVHVAMAPHGGINLSLAHFTSLYTTYPFSSSQITTEVLVAQSVARLTFNDPGSDLGTGIGQT